jgi:hypothetical protein
MLKIRFTTQIIKIHITLKSQIIADYQFAAFEHFIALSVNKNEILILASFSKKNEIQCEQVELLGIL